MHITRQSTSDTSVKLSITAEENELTTVKDLVVKSLGSKVRIQGFRPGKAPAHLLERSLDQATLHTQFLERCVNDLYVQAAQHEKLRPVNPPEIAITKFVPFSALEFTADVTVVGEIKLPDYKKIKVAKAKANVTEKDVKEVLTTLRQRAATRETVKRSAKKNDQVTIDFKGADAKTKQPIDGAEGTAYPIILGSDTFIPGFEDELIGMKTDESKDFPLTFPKDYSVANLQSKKVIFTVKVSKVEKLIEPPLDDAFAATVGPFTNLDELTSDIKKQLKAEREQQDQNDFNNQLLQKITDEAVVPIPKELIDNEIDSIEEEERRNIIYRGQTWQEHLEQEGLTADEHREKNRDAAALRVKAGLVLAEIANVEAIEVSLEEITYQIELLRGRYTDPKMISELDTTEARQSVANRILSEKTFLRLAETCTA